MLTLGLLGVLMTFGAWYCISVPGLKAQIAGWVGTPLFGLCAAYALWHVGNREPMVVIDASGIDYRRLPVGVVPWADVVEVGVGEIRGPRFLCVELRNEPAYRERLGWIRRMLAGANRGYGFPLLSIPFNATDQSIETALSAIERFRGT